MQTVSTFFFLHSSPTKSVFFLVLGSLKPGKKKVLSRSIMTSRHAPSIQVMSSSSTELVFLLKDSNVGFVNAIRRTILGQVPTMAIDVVDIRRNESPLGNEVLAHRLSLVPFCSETKDDFEYHARCCCTKKREMFSELVEQYPERCCENKCSRCSVEFSINVINESKTDKLTVTSNDIKPKGDSFVRPIYYESDVLAIPLTRLGPDQTSCLVDVIARKGNGDMHAKWNPVSVAAYKPVAHIQIDKQQATPGLLSQIAQSCPSKVFRMHNDTIEIEDASRCTFCQECVHASPAGMVKVLALDTSFIFTIEVAAEGILSPRDVLKSALMIFKKEVADFRAQFISSSTMERP